MSCRVGGGEAPGDECGVDLGLGIERAAEGSWPVEDAVAVDVTGIRKIEQQLDAGLSSGQAEVLMEDVDACVDEGDERAGATAVLGGDVRDP